MNHARTLQALGLLLLVGAPACEGKFGDLGNDNATAGHAGIGSAVGGAATGGAKGPSTGGAPSSGGNPSSSTTRSCVYVPLPMPNCNNGATPVMQFDSAGCPTGYVCSSVGAGGAESTGSGTSCGAIPMVMPQCTTGTAELQYDSAGCPTGYVCPNDPNACVCTGTHPMVANVICSDGSTGGPVCSRQADGTCSWILRSCPPDSGSGGAPSAGGAAGVGGSNATGCLYNGTNYAVGASFKSSDGCNTCGCTSNGLVACTLMACIDPASGGTTGAGGTSGTTCGAVPMVMPVCTDGTAVMKYDAAGCPIGYQCPENACQCTGPGPKAPTVLCADGTTGGPTCAVKSDGTCYWTIRACPIDPGAGGASGFGGATAAAGSTGVACVYNQITYAPGASFAAGDGCNTCSCSATGLVMCTLRACAAPATGGTTGTAVSA